MNRRALVAVIVLGLLVGVPALVVNLPAARVLAWTDPAAMVVHGASGPLRAGRAARVELQDSPALSPLTEVTWDLVLWRLLTGVLHADVRAQLAGLTADGHVSVTPLRTVRVDDLDLHGPVAGLARQAGWPVLVGGDLRAHIVHARFEAGQPPRAVRARATWRNARLYTPMPFSLGEVEIDIEPVAGGQRATIDAGGGELAIAGTWELHGDGHYLLDLRLEVADGAPPQLHEILVLLAAREEGEGRYRIRLEGRRQ